MKKNKTLWIVVWALWAFLDLMLLIFALPFGIVLTIILLIVFFSTRNGQKKRAYLLEQGVPADHKAAMCYEGGAPSNLVLFWTTPDALHLCASRPQVKGGDLTKITIPKDDIVAFTMTGDVTTQTNVKGGGASIGGALVGAAVAGPVGALIGGHKKVKTQTTTTDTRRTFLKFRESGAEKTMQFSDELYNELCLFCLEKKI